ncbi:unnamed protein product [Enterobius vermicularis]|uniref:ANK_REP_REGION domain-containing protein n=1 Tax=Enterobius vermicularis TaxID=51028 RepID=A0A0N4VQ89_ENTVE|nr:unnamed protein product [Enterobius vermicularis]
MLEDLEKSGTIAVEEKKDQQRVEVRRSFWSPFRFGKIGKPLFSSCKFIPIADPNLVSLGMKKYNSAPCLHHEFAEGTPLDQDHHSFRGDLAVEWNKKTCFGYASTVYLQSAIGKAEALWSDWILDTDSELSLMFFAILNCLANLFVSGLQLMLSCQQGLKSTTDDVIEEIWELNGEAGRSLLGVLLTSSACITLDKCRDEPQWRGVLLTFLAIRNERRDLLQRLVKCGCNATYLPHCIDYVEFTGFVVILLHNEAASVEALKFLLCNGM